MTQQPPSHRTSPPQAEIAALVGQIISERYRIDGVIATGGMGAVYRAEHVLMQKEVAIKVLSRDTIGFPELVSRFEREAIAGAHLDHPNVASASDFGRLEDGSYFLVLQYVPGVTLRELLNRRRLSPARAAQIARQIAAGLEGCHRKGVIHRDLKPRNVIVDVESGHTVIIDFGFARVPMRRQSSAGEEDEITRREITVKGFVFGTIAYMAPETAQGMDAVDARSDLYALGLILYEMLAGRHPFDARDPTELFLSQRATIPPPISVRSPGTVVPAWLEAIAMRLLQKNPDDRYASAAAVIDAIDRAALASVMDVEATPIAGAHAVSIPSASSSSGTAAVDVTSSQRRALASWSEWRTSSWGTRASWIGGTVAALAAAIIAVRTTQEHAAMTAPRARAFGRGVTPIAERVIADERASRERDARAAGRARLRDAAMARDWDAGADALVALGDGDPGALEDHDLAMAAEAIAMHVALENDPSARAVFTTLAERSGSGGIDVLYDIVSTRGGSRGAGRAGDYLRREDVRGRASPALSVAMALRAAPCVRKRELFERAAAEGDARALLLLERLRAPRFCGSAGACCYLGNRSLDAAIRALKARLGSE